MFSTVEASTTQQDQHLVFTLHETFDETSVFMWSFLCGFTFFVFPAFVSADFSLETTLYEGGVQMGTAKAEDEIHLVMEILLLPVTPFFFPPSVENDLLRNMALHTLRELMSPRTP